jgi:hypothetical protein
VLKLTTSHLSNNGLLQLKACFYGSLVLLFVTGAEAGNDTYEPTQPPRIIANTAARNAIGGFGHPYITLGTDDASGRDRRRWLIPRSADDDHWSKFGLPVTGMLGVSYDDPTLAFELLSTRRVSPPRQEGPCLRRTWGAHAPTRCAWVRAPSYRLRFKTPDALSLVSRTIWLDPCTIMSITPEIEYSLL